VSGARPISGHVRLTPSRLILARKRRGMTLVELSAATEVSVRSLSAYENGRQTPSPGVLRRLAAALDMPVEFLQAGDVDEIPVDAISFRAISKLTAGQRDTARGAGRIALLLAEWIEQRFHLPEAQVPSLPTLDPETAAEVVRARWGLGVAPLGSLVRLLEAHGVRVFSLAAECAAVDAFSFYWRQTPYVLLNTTKSGERGRFDAAHELGHLVLHSEHHVPHGPDAEQEANRFAAAFLMPRASVLAHGLNNATIDRILVAKQTWRVAAMAACMNSTCSPTGATAPPASTYPGAGTAPANPAASPGKPHHCSTASCRPCEPTVPPPPISPATCTSPSLNSTATSSDSYPPPSTAVPHLPHPSAPS